MQLFWRLLGDHFSWQKIIDEIFYFEIAFEILFLEFEMFIFVVYEIADFLFLHYLKQKLTITIMFKSNRYFMNTFTINS